MYYNTTRPNKHTITEKKGILVKTSSEDNITGYKDIDNCDKILLNIISNAIKYTP